jgi:hypothetical protein
MHVTRLLAAAIFGLLAAHPSPSQDAPSDPDRTVAGGATLPAGWRAPTDRGRALGDATAELDVQGLVEYRVTYNLDAHIGALEGHRQ